MRLAISSFVLKNVRFSNLYEMSDYKPQFLVNSIFNMKTCQLTHFKLLVAKGLPEFYLIGYLFIFMKIKLIACQLVLH